MESFEKTTRVNRYIFFPRVQVRSRFTLVPERLPETPSIRPVDFQALSASGSSELRYGGVLEVPLLAIHLSCLEEDGYYATKALSELNRMNRGHWGIYGSFHDHKKRRYYLVLPTEQANLLKFRSYSWEVVQWPTT